MYDITVRPLTADDIANLPQIRPTYRSPSILAVERSGEGVEVGWRLVERTLPEPFDKGPVYDFSAHEQEEIRERLSRPEDTYQRVAEHGGRLVALLEAEIHYWNNTVWLWNLMIDLAYRRQGLGRRLWRRAVDFAREAEVRAIMLETQNTNVAACRFYARMGCHLVGLNEAYYTNDGTASEVALFWLYPLLRRPGPAAAGS
jgi:ribosomal protein S18 acetylase RimI-like enzyme